MVNAKGLISRDVIKGWLEGYAYLASGTRPPDAQVTNTGGPKSADGVSGARLNKIMLDAAMMSLDPLPRACLRAKYVHNLTGKQATSALGIGSSTYATQCKKGIDGMYYHVNRGAANSMELLAKIGLGSNK